MVLGIQSEPGGCYESGTVTMHFKTPTRGRDHGKSGGDVIQCFAKGHFSSHSRCLFFSPDGGFCFYCASYLITRNVRKKHDILQYEVL